MNTDIAISENRDLAPADYVPVAGAENLTPDDFSLPTLKLVQAQTTTDDALKHLGEYVKTDTGDYFSSPRALIVGIQKSRILFPEYGADDKDPLCRSDNALSPRQEFIGAAVMNELIPALCAECEFSRWGEGGAAPPCSLSENWAAILDGGEIVILRLRGASARARGMLKNIMRANKLARRSTYVQLGSTFKRSDKGQFYVATVAALKDRPPAESLDLAAQLAGLNLAARAADEQAQPAGNDDDWTPPASEDEIPF